MTKPRHSDAYRNLFHLAEMLKQIQHDCHCHSDEGQNLFIIAEMLKQVQHDAFNPSLIHSFTH